MENILIEIGNDAKTFGADYVIPNIIMAYLLSHRRGSKLTLQLETQDPAGEIPGESYYDLFRLETAEGEGLCIPFPLIKQEVATLLRNSAQIIERKNHSRERTYSQEKMEKIKERMYALESPTFSLATLRRSVFEILDPDECSEVYAVFGEERAPDSEEITPLDLEASYWEAKLGV